MPPKIARLESPKFGVWVEGDGSVLRTVSRTKIHAGRTYIRVAYNRVVVLEVGFKEMYMTLWKRIERLWSLLTPEEVFDEHSSLGHRTRVLRAPRA